MARNSKFKPTFYIAHTFGERHYIRDVLIPKLLKLGINTRNPFYNPDGTWKKKRLEIKIADTGGESLEWVKTVKSRSVDIVDTDLDLIFLGGDGIIAYMPEGSTGTTCEIWSGGGMFKWILKRNLIPKEYMELFLNMPVFLVTASSRLFMHPWIKYATVKVFKTETGLINYLKREMPRLRILLKERRERIAKRTL